ncbi:MAG: bifunctional oligoribonuclease/PAP phosphatase NrnA [Lentimicrobiaceae bacterium]|nr:bifunctional oligoribonuclease/PAP phosphatase NrnA [Lentimicrobiaceae bacterium]
MSKILIFNSIINLFKTYKKVVIVSHVNPDGDAIGSSLALYLYLKKLGSDVHVIVPNDYPSFLSWMPYIQDVLIYDKNVDEANKIMTEAELFCYLDFNTQSRTGVMHNDLCRYNSTPKILIDHHIGADTSQFVACFSETEISSTSEMIAEFIKYQGFDNYLDDDIATNIIVGMITDTGTFSHSIFKNTFSIFGDILSSTTVNYKKIHQNIYNTSTENRLRLLGFLINDRMTILEDYNTAIIYASKSDLERFNYQVGDTEGVVNYPLTIGNIKMSVLFTEKQDVIRLSLRSKDDFSVNDMSRKHFNGGGHLNAAGGTLYCSLEEAIEKFKSVLPEYKEALK